jgi:arylsulfatase A-like enzyme
MTRRQSLGAIVAAALPCAAQPQRPNILLINADDQRFDTIRALGNRDIHTPNLDGLVRRGFHFTNMYSQGGLVGAMCLPSRTMLMTGRSVFRIPKPQERGGHPILAKALESAGYQTFHVGKRGNTYVPASQAFQTCLFSEDLSPDRAQHSRLHADRVIDFLRGRKRDSPFFVYLAPSVPHDPRVAEERFMKMYDPAKIPLPRNYMPEHPFDNGDLKIRDEMLAAFPRTPEEMRKHLAEYYGTITCFDHHIGRIVSALGEMGQLANTMVVFTSDQGLAVGGRHGLMGKQNLYEHFKSPLVFAGPGIRKGRSAALVQMHDMFPTLCALAGTKPPEGVEGENVVPVIQGSRQQVREFAFGVYKDVQRMVRDSRHKLIWYPKAARFQLFDVVADPWELADLSARPERSAKLAELKRALAARMDEFGDVMKERPV